MISKTMLQLVRTQHAVQAAVITPAATLTFEQLIHRASTMRERGLPPNRILTANSADVASFISAIVAYEGWLDALYLLPAQTGTRPSNPLVEEAYEPPVPLARGTATRIMLPTSGTTGAPKFIAHTLATLSATVKPSTGTSLQRWGLVYDPARFAGLQVVLQSLLGGATLVAPPLEDLAGAVRFMTAHGVTAVSATPSYWRRLLMLPDLDALQLRQITLGGETADDLILQALQRRFPDTRVTHIYASTEAGVAFSVKDGKAGFPADYLRAGTLALVRLRISADGHLLVQRVRQEHQADVGAPQDGEGFVDTGDLVERRGDRVHFLGRASGVINVGGNKVSPEMVEIVLRRHPQVIAARVYGKANPVLGCLVAAEVQVMQGTPTGALEAELRDLCRLHLPKYQWPASIRIVDELAISASGKVQRPEWSA